MKQGRPLHILIIEDDDRFARYLEMVLATSSQGSFTAESRGTLESGKERLAQGEVDAVLLDLELPGTRGLDTLHSVLQDFPELPVVVLTGTVQVEEMAVHAVRQGAQDYLFKGSVGEDVLTRCVRYAVERKQGELALCQKTEELERSNRDLEHFASVASHDLQAPLRTVTAYLELLRERYQHRLDQDADDFIDFAVDGARRMQDLVRDLLEFSRVTMRGKPFSQVDAEKVLAEALANLRAAITESGAQVTHDPLPRVRVDGPQLVRVLQNLLDNAIKYRAEAPPLIHVSAHSERREWIFSVRDNGIGIAPEHHERIFLIFRRLHPRHRYPGTGLGLAMCRRIIERHHGRMWVESQVGQGATFYFSLPHHPEPLRQVTQLETRT